VALRRHRPRLKREIERRAGERKEERERRSADVKVRGSRSADVKVWRCRSADVKVWRCRSADVRVWRCRSADVLQRLLFYEEPFAGALGKNARYHDGEGHMLYDFTMYFPSKLTKKLGTITLSMSHAFSSYYVNSHTNYQKSSVPWCCVWQRAHYFTMEKSTKVHKKQSMPWCCDRHTFCDPCYKTSHKRIQKKLVTMMRWLTHIILPDNEFSIKVDKKAWYHHPVNVTCFLFLLCKFPHKLPKKLATMMRWLTHIIFPDNEFSIKVDKKSLVPSPRQCHMLSLLAM